MVGGFDAGSHRLNYFFPVIKFFDHSHRQNRKL